MDETASYNNSVINASQVRIIVSNNEVPGMENLGRYFIIAKEYTGKACAFSKQPMSRHWYIRKCLVCADLHRSEYQVKRNIA